MKQGIGLGMVLAALIVSPASSASIVTTKGRTAAQQATHNTIGG